MKLKFVFMFLIGMISFTAMAYTPLTDQKQKTEFVEHSDVMTADVNVLDYTLKSIDFKVAQCKSQKALFILSVDKATNYKAISEDVGWRNSQRLLTFIKKTKPLQNSKHYFDFIWIHNKSKISIRSDC